MASKPFSFKSLLFFFSKILLRRLKNPRSLHRKSSFTHSSHVKLQRYPSLKQSRTNTSSLSNQTVVFDVEGALLKSSSLFPYFMLVAFEAGGLLRALFLFLVYPFVCLMNEDMGLKVMVMVSFCGIRKESFRVGRAVLPKFLLEEVGVEGFEEVVKRGRKVGVSGMPRVMVEGFLREYLEIDVVVGRELKVFKGYYVGLMEDEKKSGLSVEEFFGGEKKMGCEYDDVIGIGGFDKIVEHHHLFSQCKEIYIVTKADKRSWQYLPKQKYPKPLIFHDGRLAIKPTPLTIFAIVMWAPMGLFLAIIRAIAGLSLPKELASPILSFTGLRTRGSKPISSTSTPNKTKGTLYVCNHRTLFDPLYLYGIIGKPLTAVTYSLSRVSEILAPIKTVRLTRNRDRDAMMMDKLLSQGDLVICPEGTTCREPFLLRFSPLFAEMSDQIVPVAMDVNVSMFYGTTAGGFKCLDPLFFLMNPFPSYDVKLLEMRSGSSACLDDGGESRLRVANEIQKEIGEALGFECTKLTRKDKYLMLAGNEGIVKSGTA